MKISQEKLKLAFLFAVSYIGLYFAWQVLPSMFSLPLRSWAFSGSLLQTDYMYTLMPVIGFFMTYLMIDWIDSYYKTSFAHSVFFPVVFVALSLAAYYVQLYWYFLNIAQLSGQSAPVFDYVAQLLDSAMLLFVLAGILGWVSHLVVGCGMRGKGAAKAESPKKPAKK